MLTSPLLWPLILCISLFSTCTTWLFCCLNWLEAISFCLKFFFCLPLLPSLLFSLLFSESQYFLLMVEFQWFLIALSVLPGNSFAMRAHWLPNIWWAWYIMSSSCSVHALFLILGFRWLCHRSRHCFPILPLRWRAISVHFLAPYLFTNSITFSSSYKKKLILNFSYRKFRLE